jgi:hypothetical protein
VHRTRGVVIPKSGQVNTEPSYTKKQKQRNHDLCAAEAEYAGAVAGHFLGPAADADDDDGVAEPGAGGLYGGAVQSAGDEAQEMSSADKTMCAQIERAREVLAARGRDRYSLLEVWSLPGGPKGRERKRTRERRNIKEGNM